MAVTERKSVPERSRRRQPGLGADRIMNWLAFGVLLVAAIIWLIPLAWAVDTALKTESATTTVVPITWIPPSGLHPRVLRGGAQPPATCCAGTSTAF